MKNLKYINEKKKRRFDMDQILRMNKRKKNNGNEMEWWGMGWGGIYVMVLQSSDSGNGCFTPNI